MASRLFFALMKDDAGARSLLFALPEVFPWVQFLPTDDVRGFLVELVSTIRAAADLGNMAAIAPVVAAWKGTAEIYSDPELLKAATVPLDGTDYGQVPDCSAARRSGDEGTPWQDAGQCDGGSGWLTRLLASGLGAAKRLHTGRDRLR